MGQLIQFKFPDSDRWGYAKMSKFELLEEMVRFQEEKGTLNSDSLEIIARGKSLFTQLQKQAETPDLRLICGSYLNQLEARKLALRNKDN